MKNVGFILAVIVLSPFILTYVLFMFGCFTIGRTLDRVMTGKG